MFSIIAAIGKNRELGKKGELIFHIKDDMKFFRETTSGHKIVMGHKTWDSLPHKLPNRENIVISRQDFDGPDLIVHDLDNFIAKNQDTLEEIFIIGGGTIYEKFLPFATNLYLTEIDASDPAADTYFPDFNRANYTCELIQKGKENDLNFQIVHYKHNG